MPRPLDAYAFPASPVCTAKWDARAWLRFARKDGVVRRLGPAPSMPHPLRDGWHAPFCGLNEKGAALYDTARAFQGVF
jgi:hypothetical protein